METEGVFENIAERIKIEINKAQKTVHVAVAWFTNKSLFNELLKKAENGCSISILISNDDINLNSSIDFNLLNIGKSGVFKIGDGNLELMHNKFCVIDHNTVISGSYNWSYKAETNFENVIITRNDTSIAEQFISEFNNIRNRYYPDFGKDELIFPLDKIIRRLEILKNYILLEDTEALNNEKIKLKEFGFNADLSAIIDDLTRKNFSFAIKKIQEFISKNQQLLIRIDPENAALRLEIKILENQLNAFDNEKTELEKVMSEFLHRQTIELGGIILEILRLRKLKYKNDDAKYEEARQDEKQYRDHVNIESEKEILELTDDQKVELKKKFRKATVICHPDKVSDEFKTAAHEIFIELKHAYDVNDLKRVVEILNDLERGKIFKSKSDTLSENHLLKAAIAKLRLQIEILQNEIMTIKENKNYKLIISIDNWDKYFKLTKEKLIKELESLKRGIIL